MFKEVSKVSKFCCVVLVAIFIIISSLGACKGSPTPMAASGAGLVTKPFEGNYAELDDPQDIANALYQEAVTQPHFLAAVVSAYPSLLEQCGVETDDPVEINRQLCLAENGGKLQKNLLQALQEMLESPDTHMTLDSDGYGGYAYMLYPIGDFDSIPKGEATTPADITLVWVPIYQNQSSIILVSPAEEVGCFDLYCDLQRFTPLS